MDIKKNISLKEYNTFKIGGEAEFFVMPQSIEEMIASLKWAKEQDLELTILGRGSNVLIGDGGIRGLVMVIADGFVGIDREGDSLQALSGVKLTSLTQRAMSEGLTGLQFATGIPGTLGGALYMNAGAYGGEMKDVVTSVTVMDPTTFEVKTFQKEDCGFAYRKSHLEGYIILSATLGLQKGDPATIQQAMQQINEKRRDKQPLQYPSAGSTFKRPEGYYAGALIEEAGLKGFSIGGAEVSEKHAGFIINKGGATAKDVADLIAHVQKTILQKTGIHLEREVKFLGDFVS